jgi:DNA helicase-2/ATP-dependent DNA helicase PcrA
LGSLKRRVGELTLSELFDAVDEETGYKGAFDENAEEEMQRWANVLELRADLSRYDEMAPGDALPSYLEQVALVADVDSLDGSERGRVTLITLHSAKGLEFPVVFIAGVEEGLLPINRAIENEYKDSTQVEEERRLFYVGITRAEKLLYITHVGMRTSYGRTMPAVGSRFLAALPEQHVKSLGGRSGAFGAPRSTTSLMERARKTQPTAYGSGAGSPAAAPVIPASRTFAVGERVFHPHFGEGTIAEAVERRADQELAIDFARHGRKRLLASLAKLDLIE